MFGNERITYGDMPILLGKYSVTKATKLLLILLHSGQDGIARNRLLDDLYGRHELENVSNNLRVTLHRLKKMLIEAGLPEYEYIVSKGGMFYWNSPMETVVDTAVFKSLIRQAGQETDQSRKVELLTEACEMYGGEFLHKLSGEEWVLIESVRYKKLYEDALREVCEYRMKQKEYDTVLKLTDTACEIYPLDEWQSVKLECYIAMNRYQDAIKVYESTAKMLVEELGILPSEKMMKRFKEMSTQISSRPKVIDEIKHGLQEETQESGALYCTLPGFRDAYRVIRRGMERSGQSVFLMVCTLLDSLGRPMENSKRLDAMSESLFHAIKNSLRKCDSFTKYGPAQFVVLLMGTNEENCQIVIDRISRNFTKDCKSWGQSLECEVTSLYDIINEEKTLFFGGR